MIFKRKNTPDEIELTVSNRTVVRVVGLVIVSLLFLAALDKAAHALLLIFTAVFLALALNAPVHWVSQRLPGKRRGNRTLGTAASFFIVIALLFGFFASIVPPLVTQTSDFLEHAPKLVQDIRSDDSSLGHFVREHKLQGQVDKLSSQLSSRVSNIGSTAFSTVSHIGSSIFATLTVLVLTFMMLTEGPHWVSFMRRFIRPKQREHADWLAQEMYKVIKGYVNGQVLLAALAAVLIVPVLFILGVSYPIALMVIIFICGLIPMVGHTIGAVIVSTVALFQSPVTALIVLAYYILYQQIENYVVQPRIQSNSTNMSPLLVFSSVLVGISFGGLFGGLVAIPVAGCARILVLDYLESRNILTPSEVKQEIS